MVDLCFERADESFGVREVRGVLQRKQFGLFGIIVTLASNNLPHFAFS